MIEQNSTKSVMLQPTPASGHPSREGREKGTHPGFWPPLPRGVQTIPSLDGWPAGPGWVLARFLRDRRAAATALTAALLTIMALTGIAFAGDHVWLTYQRDLLKAATDAASIATTKALSTLSSSLTEAQVKASLKPIAERYILANIPAGYRDRAEDTLTIDLTPNYTAGTVDVAVTADLGGAVFGAWLWGTVASKTAAESKTERVESITEVVLAIDITASMDVRLPYSRGTRRVDAAKAAAKELVAILTDGAGKFPAVGLVPWDYRVRLAAAEQTRWQDNAWAQYPPAQYYPNPGGNRAGEWERNLPAKPENWIGCVDRRRTSGNNPPGLSTILPTAEPFTMGFYSATVPESHRDRVNIAFACDPALQHVCYSGCAQDPNKCGTIENNIPYQICHGQGTQQTCFDATGSNEHYQPQRTCMTSDARGNAGPPLPPIQPLTTDITTVKKGIEDLDAVGNFTYSALGLLWGHRLLAPTWRKMWGDPVHPVDPGQHKGTQKALVLLTDGEDTYGRYSKVTLEDHRQAACAAAKADGIKVFIVAIGNHRQRGLLTHCSSQADDPGGQYIFIHKNVTAEELKNTFQQIGRQLVRFRRVS